MKTNLVFVLGVLQFFFGGIYTHAHIYKDTHTHTHTHISFSLDLHLFHWNILTDIPIRPMLPSCQTPLECE